MYKQQEELGWLRRPARRQVNELSLQERQKGEAAEINLWSGKRVRGASGGAGPSGRHTRERSQYRCRPELDVGRTRGSDAKQMQFCLYFAKLKTMVCTVVRGCCSQGSACVYLHRLPTEPDEQYHKRDIAADIFGREKRAEAEGYRRGAGTFERDVRTLYVNYEGAGSLELPVMRKLVEEDFGFWGPLKRVHIAHNKTLAFVEYEWRSSAEFAKEAMHKQGLTGSTQCEILTVRWANEDPNPTQVVKKHRTHMDAFEKAAMASWEALPEEQKQARIQQLQMAAALQNGRVISDYPSTDVQYGDAGSSATTGDGHCPEDQQYPDTDAQYASAPVSDYGWVGAADGPDLSKMSAEEYAAYTQQYHAQFSGWYGHAPDVAAKGVGVDATTLSNPISSPAHHEQQADSDAEDDKGGNALGLLAGYGSGSDDDKTVDTEL